jgi:hypothetical protein
MNLSQKRETKTKRQKERHKIKKYDKFPNGPNPKVNRRLIYVNPARILLLNNIFVVKKKCNNKPFSLSFHRAYVYVCMSSYILKSTAKNAPENLGIKTT